MKKWQQNLNRSVIKMLQYKTYLDSKLSKIEGDIPYTEKKYSEFKLNIKKQCEEEVSFERALKMTIQEVIDKGLFNNFDKSDEELKGYLFIERPRGL